jgi:hypothetical protein
LRTLLAHRGGRVADFVDCAREFLLSHAKMPGPVLNAILFVQNDLAALRSRNLNHLFSCSDLSNAAAYLRLSPTTKIRLENQLDFWGTDLLLWCRDMRSARNLYKFLTKIARRDRVLYFLATVGALE